MKTMKALICSLLLVMLATAAFADIQSAPSSDYGPTRKLARGFANIFFGVTEIPHQMELNNGLEGNATGFSLGIVKGTGRMLARLGFGLFEVVLFPFPMNKGYYPPYQIDTTFINSGFSEFPPELGFETRYDYVRTYPTN